MQQFVCSHGQNKHKHKTRSLKVSVTSYFRCLSPDVLLPELHIHWCVCVGGGYIRHQVLYMALRGRCVVNTHIKAGLHRAEARGRESQSRHGHVLACQLFCPCGLCAG